MKTQEFIKFIEKMIFSSELLNEADISIRKSEMFCEHGDQGLIIEMEDGSSFRIVVQAIKETLQPTKRNLADKATQRIQFSKTNKDLVWAAMTNLKNVEEKYTKDGEFLEEGCDELAKALNMIKGLYQQFPNIDEAREMRLVLKDYSWLKN